MSKLLGFLLLLVVDIPLVLLRGVVLLDLWNWFGVPLGLPSVTMAHALGISILVGLLTKKSDDKRDEREFGEIAIAAVINSVFTSLIAWGFGGIVHSFM